MENKPITDAVSDLLRVLIHLPLTHERRIRALVAGERLEHAYAAWGPQVTSEVTTKLG